MKRGTIIFLIVAAVLYFIFFGKRTVELIMDKRTGDRWNKLVPDMRAYADAIEAEAQGQGLDVGFYSGWRDAAEEQANIDKGVAFETDPLNSYHAWGLAIDMVFRDSLGQWYWPDPKTADGMALWQKLGAIGEKYGLTWGGRWKSFDGAHFQQDAVKLATIRQQYSDNVDSFLQDAEEAV